MAESVHGRFLWYELLTSDPAGAKDFYPMVTGWGGDVWHPTGGDPYHMWLNGDRAIGGLLPVPLSERAPGGSPQWLAHVGVDDIDAGIAAAEALGATKLMGPMDIESVGRFAVLADPEGAQFSIYRPAAEPPNQGDPGVPGNFAWQKLSKVSDRITWPSIATRVSASGSE